MTFRFAGSAHLAAAAFLACAFAAGAAPAGADSSSTELAIKKVTETAEAGFQTFLDRLMQAESSGRDFLANPRSTALGPFQLIKGTFLYVARRYFADEIASLTEEELLALRTDRAFARRAAAAYCRESAAYLSEQGLEPTFAHLRLAYLVGPYAALRLLQAAATAPVADVLGPAAMKANPFMAGMTAADLIAKAARDVAKGGDGLDGAPAPRVRLAAMGPSPRLAPQAGGARTGEKIKCNAKLASCRRFIALKAQKARLAESKDPDKSQPRGKKSKS